jgi:hypothetical protein
MLEVARQAVAYIKARPRLSNAERISLGLTVQRENRGSVHQPVSAPWLQLGIPARRRVQITLHDPDASGHRRPAGAAGAMIYL